MARITSDDVEDLIEIDATVSLTPFITAANELVTELCVNSGYTDARLALIEAWLAAHFYLMRDKPIASAGAGSVSVSYQYQIGLQLQQTTQGQTAMLLDTAGNLAALSKRIEKGRTNAASMTWLGTESTS